MNSLLLLSYPIKLTSPILTGLETQDPYISGHDYYAQDEGISTWFTVLLMSRRENSCQEEFMKYPSCLLHPSPCSNKDVVWQHPPQSIPPKDPS